MKPTLVLEPSELDACGFVCTLANATDEREVGGKAHNLARLIALGAPVPLGVVITRDAFDQLLELNQLRELAQRLCLALAPVQSEHLRATAERIRGTVTSAPLSQAIQEAIESIVQDLLPQSVLAVRSSAIGEDGAQASFAGQFDSILGVASTSELKDAVRACWASYWSERALSYQAARGARVDGMAVIIQQQVQAVASGVLFTRAPIGTPGAERDDLVIEYSPGLGDALVSGRIDPGRVIVSRTDWSVSGHVLGILSTQKMLELARLAAQLEHELGGPQDIEWTIDQNGKLWILQARPITSVSSPSVLWSNANVNENFPHPISPLLYSIASAGYYHYFCNLGLAFGISKRRLAMMEQPLRSIIGVHGARMYYNLTSIHSILRTAPLGEHLTRAFNQFVGAEEVTAPAAGDRRAWAVSEALALTRIAAKTAWQYLFLRRRVHAFEHTADEYAAHTHAGRLATRALAELLDDLRAFLDIRCHRWKDASLADAASMVCYALLQRSLAGKGSSSLHNRLLRALPGVPSTIPPLRLWELSRAIRSDAALLQLFATAEPAVVLETLQHDRRFAGFRSEFEQFLEQWGFRSSAELMLTVPSLQENPIPAIELLKTYSASDGEPPDVAISRQAAERLAETSKLLKGMMRRSPLNAAWVWLLLRWTQRAIAYRERARLKQALLYNRCRVVALAIGERLVRAGILRHQDDIFMLTWQEIVELGSGLAMFPQHIAELISWRRRAHAELAAMHPSDTIRLPEGQYLAAAWEAASPAHAGEDGPETALCGIGASGGRVTARAAVLADVREAGCIRRGEVLVTRQTDPGWAPVFGLISGLVIERGGMLSHGAIIAREFGLPCVVGVKNATTRIANGTIVTVDGDHGICETAGAGQPSEDRGGRG